MKRILICAGVFAACLSFGARAATPVETEMFRKEVAAGKMPVGAEAPSRIPRW